MQTPNRDLFATDATQSQYELIAPLIHLPLLDDTFLDHDRKAVAAKKRYHYLGQIAILLVAASAIFTIAEALILQGLLDNVILKFAAVTMAGFGIALQWYLIGTRQKKKWILNRFAAERLRSLKFQTFLMAHAAADTNDLKMKAEEFVKKYLARLENEMNAGISVLRNFAPGRVMDEIETPDVPVNPELAGKAQEAYKELRIDYQRNFALSEVAAFSGRRRMFNSTQDMIYLGAAIFAFISLGVKIAEPVLGELNTGWIDFTAVTLFILGSTEAIMDNALLEEQSQTRYEQYARDIEDVTMIRPGKTLSLKQMIFDMERICLNELDLFCRAADRISYRF